jgi:hypothetical protein
MIMSESRGVTSALKRLAVHKSMKRRGASE